MSCPHNPDYACFDCEDAIHRALHPRGDDPGCATCKLRSISISAQATPNRLARRLEEGKGAPPAVADNSWERGIKTDHRGVALLNERLDPIGVKEYGENRSAFEATRRQLAQ